jgi:hypothetical protein
MTAPYPGTEKLLNDAGKYNAGVAQTNAVIDTLIAETRTDFAQFDGLALKSPNTVLKINTASYNGSANNAITVSLDNGATTWVTITANADLPGKNIYYKTVLNDSTYTGSYAYEMLRKLSIHHLLSV